jgi:ribokinase
VPSYKVKAVDTTAAGDAFNGAFASSLMQGNDPMGSARWACAVAAVSVTRPGAQPSLPTREEVQRFLDTKQEVEATDQLRGG